jgi:hypothetical protein
LAWGLFISGLTVVRLTGFFFDPVVPMVGNFGFFLGAAFGLQAKL